MSPRAVNDLTFQLTLCASPVYQDYFINPRLPMIAKFEQNSRDESPGRSAKTHSSQSQHLQREFLSLRRRAILESKGRPAPRNNLVDSRALYTPANCLFKLTFTTVYKSESGEQSSRLVHSAVPQIHHPNRASLCCSNQKLSHAHTKLSRCIP